MNAQFEGYIEHKPNDVKLFQGQFGGRAIRFTRSASMFIKSDFYPLLRVTVFSTKKQPYCNFQVASMGMTSFTIANNIPPGNLTSSTASSYCIFYSYPYEGINGTLVNTGKKFKTRLYDVESKTTTDLQQPVMLYLYGKSSSVKTFQVGINYGVISQTLNPFLVTIGVYAPIAWITISVVVFLIIVAVVIGVVYYKRKKKTKGYSEISEADPLSL